MSVFGYLRGKLEKYRERKYASLREEIKERQQAIRQRKKHEEAKHKQRAKGRYSGRRVDERRGLKKFLSERPSLTSYGGSIDMENVSLEEAKEIFKNKAGSIRYERVILDFGEGKFERYTFYNAENVHVGTYLSDTKFLFYYPVDVQSKFKYDIKKLEGVERIKEGYIEEDPEFRDFTRKLMRRRFSDVPSLLSIKIKRVDVNKIPENVGGLRMGSGIAREFESNIIIPNNYQMDSPEMKLALTHELSHERRYERGEDKSESDMEEIETEMEAIQRGTIVDYGSGGFSLPEAGSYWGRALGRNWRSLQKDDYKILSKMSAPIGYPNLIIPSTRKIVSNISQRKSNTNIWDATIRKGALVDLIKSQKDESIGENISMLFKTSEGDFLHTFSPTGKAKPKEIARFLDKTDGITGEEDIWQVLDRGKKLLVSAKDTPDRMVKKPKQKKKPVVFNMFPQFREFEFPTILLQKSVDTKTTSGKKIKQSKKDPIDDILGFKFFK